MSPYIKFALIAVAIVGLVFFIRSRVAKCYSVTRNDFDRIIGRLKSSSVSPAWASIFVELVPGDESSQIQLDYSATHGNLEFNWTLLPPKNIEDKALIMGFLRDHGFICHEMTADNGCPLVNVTGSNLENVGELIMSEFYKVDPQFSMYCEGISWP